MLSMSSLGVVPKLNKIVSMLKEEHVRGRLLLGLAVPAILVAVPLMLVFWNAVFDSLLRLCQSKIIDSSLICLSG